MCSELMGEHMEQYKTCYALSRLLCFDKLSFFSLLNCFQPIKFYSSPQWSLNRVEFEVGEWWSKRWWWLFNLLTQTSGASCTSSRCLSQGWCAETRLLTQVGLYPMFPASSYLQFELLMPSVVCGWRVSPLLVQLEKKRYHFGYGPVMGAWTMLSFYLPIKLTKPNTLLNLMCLLSFCTDHVLHFEYS